MDDQKQREGDGKILKSVRGAITVLLLTPSVWLLLLWSLVLRARVHVGEWPHPQRGTFFDDTWVDTSIDPNRFGLHYTVVLIGYVATAYAILCGLPAVLLGVIWSRVRTRRVIWSTFLITSAVVVALVTLDPGACFEWFMD